MAQVDYFTRKVTIYVFTYCLISTLLLINAKSLESFCHCQAAMYGIIYTAYIYPMVMDYIGFISNGVT